MGVPTSAVKPSNETEVANKGPKTPVAREEDHDLGEHTPQTSNKLQ